MYCQPNTCLNKINGSVCGKATSPMAFLCEECYGDGKNYSSPNYLDEITNPLKTTTTPRCHNVRSLPDKESFYFSE